MEHRAMKKQDLRTKVEKRRSMTDDEWDYLAAKGYVEEALDPDHFEGDEEQARQRQVEYLVSELDALPNRAGKNRLQNQKRNGGDEEKRGSARFDIALTDEEYERAKWLLEIQIREADKDPRVTEFRERYLPDGPLVAMEAEEFLESPEARMLDALALHLQKFHGWHKGEAAWWVLTADAPSVRPVRVSYRQARSWYSPDLYLITLEAPPWISAKTLARTFADMKRRMRAERKLPSARNLRIARFVESRLWGAGETKLSFEDIRQQWNRENPDDEVKDRRDIWKIHSRLPVEKIAHPPYTTDIEREITPDLQRQLSRQARHSPNARR
jgi:hypothetical protein